MCNRALKFKLQNQHKEFALNCLIVSILINLMMHAISSLVVGKDTCHIFLPYFPPNTKLIWSHAYDCILFLRKSLKNWCMVTHIIHPETFLCQIYFINKATCLWALPLFSFGVIFTNFIMMGWEGCFTSNPNNFNISIN